jgi:hypothetical protein
VVSVKTVISDVSPEHRSFHIESPGFLPQATAGRVDLEAFITASKHYPCASSTLLCCFHGYSAKRARSSPEHDHSVRESQNILPDGCMSGCVSSVPAGITTAPICGTTLGIGLPHFVQKLLK